MFYIVLKWNRQIISIFCLQCFDAVGWVSGRASGLYKTEWWGAGVIICLDRGADLHMAQLMPLALTVSSVKSRFVAMSLVWFGVTFLVPAHPDSPEQRAFKWVCKWVIHLNGVYPLTEV